MHPLNSCVLLAGIVKQEQQRRFPVLRGHLVMSKDSRRNLNAKIVPQVVIVDLLVCLPLKVLAHVKHIIIALQARRVPVKNHALLVTDAKAEMQNLNHVQPANTNPALVSVNVSHVWLELSVLVAPS